MLPLATPPESVCLLRLSAIGDTCHVVPLLRSLQRAWPTTRFTWIIGHIEAKLMSLLPEVEFITVDKRAGLAGLQCLRQMLRGRQFDLLLHLQLSMRASIVAALVPARSKLGFDRPRARELQWLVTNARIAPRTREHVLDTFLGFATACGVHDQTLEWNLPLPDDALSYARHWIPDSVSPTMVISPCSSHVQRNWLPERYAAVARHASETHGMQVILAGGPSALERMMAAAIREHYPAVIDLVGKDTLPQMLALLARARVLLAPDSGPAHMATMVGTPVIGLYAATNPARSGPYLSRDWCIDAFPRAAREFRGRAPEALPWVTKIEQPGVMALISAAEVCDKLDVLLASRP
ncbi:MAG: glycosyltransferase family 9 protein [Gammaproteobacteria bacterium]|nr:glycosyltransferase family 9 protein [Gammaproteobacteria bacterium]